MFADQACISWMWVRKAGRLLGGFGKDAWIDG